MIPRGDEQGSKTAELLAIVLILALVFATLWGRSYLPVDETRAVAVAWEMHSANAYAVPHLAGEMYTHKPPLLAWMINACWWIAGPDSALPRLLPFAAWLLMVWGWTRLSRHPRTWWLLAGSPLALVFGGLVLYEIFLAATVVWTHVFLRNAFFNTSWVRSTLCVAAAGLALGCAGLFKGPVSLVHVVIPWLVWILVMGKGHRLKSTGLILCTLVLAMLPAALWLMVASYHGGGSYVDQLLWGQIRDRLTDAEDHRRPLWFYLWTLPLVLMPWLLMPGTWASLARWWRARHHPTDGLLFILGLVPVVVFSLVSSKQAHYLVPCMGALLAGIARHYHPHPRDRGVLIALACLPLIGLGVVFNPPHWLILDLPTVLVWLGVWAMCAGGLLWVSRQWPVPTTLSLLMIALVAWGHLVLQPTMRQRYDPSGAWSQMVAVMPADAAVAILGDTHGEFAYASRRPTALKALRTDAELIGFLDRHGDAGVVLFRVDLAHYLEHQKTLQWRENSRFRHDGETMPPIPWRGGWILPTPNRELQEYRAFVEDGVEPSSIRKRKDRAKLGE